MKHKFNHWLVMGFGRRQHLSYKCTIQSHHHVPSTGVSPIVFPSTVHTAVRGMGTPANVQFNVTPEPDVELEILPMVGGAERERIKLKVQNYQKRRQPLSVLIIIFLAKNYSTGGEYHSHTIVRKAL